MCAPTADAVTWVCAICDDTFEDNDGLHYGLAGLAEGKCACGACVVACDWCGTVVLKDAVNGRGGSETAGNDTVCLVCYENSSVCDDCGQRVHVDCMNTLCGVDRRVCDTCRRSYLYCSDCDTNYHEESDGCDCSSDEDEDEDDSHRADDCNPRWRMQTTDQELLTPTLLTLGVELEFEYMRGDRDEARRVARALPITGCLKHDGSLDDGAEWCSLPASWQRWMAEKAQMKAGLVALARTGARSHEPATCGLHIHMRKSAWTNITIYKLLRLVYGDPAFTLALSRRARAKLQQWAALEDPTKMVRKALSKLGEDEESSRYVAVNLETPHDTIELRFFRGTLKAETFWLSLEFAAAAWLWAQEAPVQQADSVHFRKWLATLAPNQYPDLRTWLSKKGLDQCV